MKGWETPGAMTPGMKEKTMKIIAYAYASGVIEFGEQTPEDALAIASGPETKLREAIGGLARHGREPGVLLVPGIPEAEDQPEAIDHLIVFRRRVERFLGRD
jgi:hypothetical protein